MRDMTIVCVCGPVASSAPRINLTRVRRYVGIVPAGSFTGVRNKYFVVGENKKKNVYIL